MFDSLTLRLLGETAPPDPKKVVFVHINKTGGTSILQALNLGKKDHLTALELREKRGKEWDGAFKFAFVRNPWDKVVSHYKYRVKTNQTALQESPISFEQWVRLSYGKKDPKYYDNPKMFQQQVAWLSDESGKLLVDFVGRFEAIEADFAAVCKQLGVRRTLPHANKTDSSKHYSKHYSDESREIIARWFADDIEKFGYQFESS